MASTSTFNSASSSPKSSCSSNGIVARLTRSPLRGFDSARPPLLSKQESHESASRAVSRARGFLLFAIQLSWPPNVLALPQRSARRTLAREDGASFQITWEQPTAKMHSPAGATAEEKAHFRRAPAPLGMDSSLGLWWFAPVLSGGGYDSEAVALFLGLHRAFDFSVSAPRERRRLAFSCCLGFRRRRRLRRTPPRTRSCCLRAARAGGDRTSRR